MLVDTLLITPTGALSPGPLSAAAVAAGVGLGVMGGFMVALGHLVVELPYFLFLVRVMGRIEESIGRFRRYLDIFSGLFMLFFAYLLVSSAIDMMRTGVTLGAGMVVSSLFLALLSGVILTGGNAYFLVWWLSVGKPIVDGARRLGPLGVGVVYGAHYAYDLVWLVLLAGLGGLARGIVVLPWILVVLSIVLGYYGVRMIVSGVTGGSRGP